MSKAKSKSSYQGGYAIVPLPVNALTARPNLNGKLDTTYYNNPILGGITGTGVHSHNYVTDFAHYIHTNIIILNRWFDQLNPRHRHFLSIYHEFQKANIYKIAKAITDQTPRFVRTADYDPLNPEPDIDEPLTQQWNELNLTLMFRKFVEEDRKHGWAIYYPFKKEKLPKYFSGFPWCVYSALEAKEQKDKRDQYGHPTLWKIPPLNKIKNATELDLSVTECVFFNSAQTLDYEGIPAGMDIWDDCIDYVFCKDSHNSFNQRMGNGFMVLPLDEGATPTEETNAKEAIKHIRTEMGLTIRQAKDNPLKPEWLQPDAGATFKESLDKIEEMIAAGIGMPLRWLKGDPHGAVESGQTDSEEVQAQLRQHFETYVPFIKKVLLHHEWITDPDEITVLPPNGMGRSEMQKAQLDQLKTETLAQKAWLTPNEQRELDGFEPTEGGDTTVQQQDQDLAEQSLAVKQKGPEVKADATDDENEHFTLVKKDKMKLFCSHCGKWQSTKLSKFAGEDWAECLQCHVSYPVQRYITDSQDLPDLTNIRTMAEEIGISPNTLGKIRKYMDKLNDPPIKTQCFSMKCDSLVGDVLEIEGPFLTPAELQYSDSKLKDLIPIDEIQKWFESNTPKELHLGVTPSDDHSSRVPLEVLLENSIGTVKAERFDKEQGVIGKYKIDLKKVDQILGSENWVRESIKNNTDLPVSVARWSKDKIQGGKRVNTNLDVRSVVLTRTPRNSKTKAKMQS